jgi:hypothetical protein
MAVVANVRRWVAIIRWWWTMPVRANHPTHRRSAEFHAVTQQRLEQRPR